MKEASETVYHKYDDTPQWPWQPVIDGKGGMVPRRPIDSWRAGNWHKIPILTGYNTNEGASFTPKKLASSEDFIEFFHNLLPSLSEEDLDTLDELYPDPLIDPLSKYLDTRVEEELGPEFKRAEQAYANFAYIAPVRHTAHFAATAGDKPVYLYHFDVNSSVIGGADHGKHIGFPTYIDDVRSSSPTLAQVAGMMHAYWTSFITTGDPNAVRGRFFDRPTWPVYIPNNGQMMVFGEGNDQTAGGGHKGTVVKVVDDKEWGAEEVKYWWDRIEKFEL